MSVIYFFHMSKSTSSKKKNNNKSADTHAFLKKSLDVEEGTAFVHKKDTAHRIKKKHHSHNDTQSEKIERELVHIYENADGSLPDMMTFEKRKPGSLLKAFAVFMISVTFLSAVVLYGYTEFQRPIGVFVEDDVILSIGGDEEVSYGDEVRYRVRFKNAQSVPVENGSIEVRYPDGFVFATSSKNPDPHSNNIWTLGSLGAGDGEFIDIFGTIYGNIDESQTFRVFLTYTPYNFSSPFQKVSTQETRIVRSPYTIVLTGADEISQGVATTFDIELVPHEVMEMMMPDHMVLVFEPGGPFALQTMDPKSDDFQDFSWRVDDISEEKVFHITGAFAGGEPLLVHSAVLMGWQEGQERSDAYVLAREHIDTSIAGEQLSIEIVANGSQQDISVQPGENIQTNVRIKNTTQETLKDVRVRMVFDAPSHNKQSILYWQGIEDDAEGVIYGEQLSDTIRRGQITWTSENISSLTSLAPGEEVSIDVGLPIKTNEQTDLVNYEGFKASLSSDVRYTIGDTNATTASQPLTLLINSDTAFEVRDDVDEAVHTITWLLSNSFHALKDIEIKADFYGDIQINQGEIIVPAGDIEYNQEAQHLVWKIGAMPVSVDVLALQLPVELRKKNPSQTQLTSKVTVTAIDTVTDSQILLIGNEVGL